MQDLWNFLLANFAPILGTAISLTALAAWVLFFHGSAWLLEKLEEVLEKLDDLF